MRSSHGLGNRVAVYAFQGNATVAQLQNHPLLKSSGAIGPNQIEDDHYDEDRAEKRPAPPGATLLVRCVEAHALHDEYPIIQIMHIGFVYHSFGRASLPQAYNYFSDVSSVRL